MKNRSVFLGQKQTRPCFIKESLASVSSELNKYTVRFRFFKHFLRQHLHDPFFSRKNSVLFTFNFFWKRKIPIFQEKVTKTGLFHEKKGLCGRGLTLQT